jgi:EAL domain-containing protein (putative c-di-GMP-specific phosphodiesterase class I)
MNLKNVKHSFKFVIEDWISLKRNPFIMFIILLLLPLIYFIVYQTGGIKFVYSHSMYIPIILAGIFYGASFGTAVAFIAGVLLGPLMPIDTLTNEMQDPINWIYRLFIFLVIGFVIGYASGKLRKEAKLIKELMSVNQETKVPNTNYLKDRCHELDYQTYSVLTILLNNHHNIIDILGTDIYYDLVNYIYTDLMKGLPEDTTIVQSDSNKLWVVIPYDYLKQNIMVIINILNQPRKVRDVPLFVDYSIGGSVTSKITSAKPCREFEESDIAARHAQLNNLVYVIGDQDKNKKRSEYDLLASFNTALNNGETYLVFQPKFDLSSMKPYGLEALMRWKHPLRGNIPPDVFIPLVEQTKLIHVLTDWVLRSTLKKCSELMGLGFHVPISLNISGKNLYDPEFYDRSMQIIKESGVPFELIEFELTESTLMINPEESMATLQKFVDKGIKISLDDFGSGYSSLAYLTQFPINYIKIDRFFMKNIDRDSSMLSIVKSTILLSKSLGYKVIVEGVETKRVVELLSSMDCEYAQGYYFAKPISSEEIIQWYKTNI